MIFYKMDNEKGIGCQRWKYSKDMTSEMLEGKLELNINRILGEIAD